MFKNQVPETKSQLTREKLFQTALELISKNGFESTTMRAIAKRAGVALGATYYYFDSKEEIVFEYYRRSHEEHVEALKRFLPTERDFYKRYQQALISKIKLSDPHKDMARALYRVAADPKSDLSPFGKESENIRNEAIELFGQVVQGSSEKFDPAIEALLPKCLWLLQMGVVLFWIYDRSANSERSYRLIERIKPVLKFLIRAIQSPFARPLRKKLLAMAEEFL